MIDVDLAELYAVPTKRLNERVRRNRKRFPKDFMFRLSRTESDALRSQFATSKTGRGGRRYLPYAFTEQGVAMLSSVLNSERAIEVNIAIMRAFVKLRQMLECYGRPTRYRVVVLTSSGPIHDRGVGQYHHAVAGGSYCCDAR
jgi:hypothetical protein